MPEPKPDLAAEWRANEDRLSKLPDNHAETQRLLERQDEIEHEAGLEYLQKLNEK